MAPDELTREELIARLEAAEKAYRALEARQDGVVEHDRLVQELQVHQVELEAQNQALREAQGHIEESRSRYVDLYDFAPIAYCTFDVDGVVLEINLTGASMFGKERARVVGKPFLTLVRIEKPDDFLRHIRRCLDAAIPVMTEITFTTARGPMEVQLVSAAVRTAREAPRSCRTALLDVTQRRVAERDARAAHESEKVLRARIEAIDRASAAVSTALAQPPGARADDLLTIIVEHARALTDAEYAALGIGGGEGRPFAPWVFSGISGEKARAIGRTPNGVGLLGSVVHAGRTIRVRDLRKHPSFSGFPTNHPPMTSFLGVPIRYGERSHGHLYLTNKTGAEEFSEDDQTAIEMLADRVGVSLEIARLRQVEAREHVRLEFLAKAGPLLAESIDYETTLNAIAHLVVPAAADLCTIALVEPDGSLRKVAAHHRDAAKQKLLDRLLGTTPWTGLPASFRATIESAKAQRQDLSPEFLRTDVPEGPYNQLLQQLGATCALLVPLVLHGRVVGTLRLAMGESGRTYTDDDLLLAQEIAHHAVLALESARLYRVAQAAIGARDNLLAVVSHDLRNYLSSIHLAAQLCSRPNVTEEQRLRHTETVMRSAMRMAELIKSLRDATMIETGHFTIDAKSEDVAGLTDEAFRTLLPQTQARSVDLKVHLEGDLSPVRCDRERVLQVFANLVGNAIKVTEAGGEIRIGASPAEAAVRFSVSDTGSGISGEQLPHIFDRYWKGRPDGTGLGLFIVKGIVEAHGGSIRAESKVGVGSTFFFTLPVEPKA